MEWGRNNHRGKIKVHFNLFNVEFSESERNGMGQRLSSGNVVRRRLIVAVFSGIRSVGIWRRICYCLQGALTTRTNDIHIVRCWLDDEEIEGR